MAASLVRYFSRISTGKVVLWCYLIWWFVTVCFYFDPSPRLWMNSLGISLVIGVALMLSVAKPVGEKTSHWQTFRLFMMPFGVSSFSSLIKGNGFILVFPPRPLEQVVSIGVCLLFIGLVTSLKTRQKRYATQV